MYIHRRFHRFWSMPPAWMWVFGTVATIDVDCVESFMMS